MGSGAEQANQLVWPWGHLNLLCSVCLIPQGGLYFCNDVNAYLWELGLGLQEIDDNALHPNKALFCSFSSLAQTYFNDVNDFL